MSEKSDDRVVAACLDDDETCAGVLRPDDERCEHLVCGRDGTALWPEVELVIPARYPEHRPQRVRATSRQAAEHWADQLWHPFGRP